MHLYTRSTLTFTGDNTMKKLLTLAATVAVAGLLTACAGGTADYSNVNEPEYAYGASSTTPTPVESQFNSAQTK